MMETAHILVIDDDEIVARTIERSLRREDFRVTITSSGVEGLKAARRRPPDLVILDIIMPGMDGFTVCEEMRSDPILKYVPILFLTAKIKGEDKITGFTAGADDYLCKPFNLDELILRIRAILRRAKKQAQFIAERNEDGKNKGNSSSGSSEDQEIVNESSLIKIGDYILDIHSYELITPNIGKLQLTPVQFELIFHLMSHPGEIFSAARLLSEVWDYPSDTGSSDLVRVHIKNLRERVEENPRSPTFIRTVPGYGYSIDPKKD